MQSTLTWFKQLDDKRKAQFLAIAGANLTDIAGHATSGDFERLSRIQKELYRAISAILARNTAFNADALWLNLNETAKPSLDASMQAAFLGAKSATETYLKDFAKDS